MLLLRFLERKALDQLKRHPRNFSEYQQVNAILNLANGEPTSVVAQKLGVSEDRLVRWARNFEFNRTHLYHQLKKDQRQITFPRNFDRRMASRIIDREVRSTMPSLSRLLLMAQRPPTAIGANLDDDPADLF